MKNKVLKVIGGISFVILTVFTISINTNQSDADAAILDNISALNVAEASQVRCLTCTTEILKICWETPFKTYTGDFVSLIAGPCATEE